MNILFLITEKFPKGMAATNRIRTICEGLSQIGNNVNVIIPTRTETYNKIINKECKGEINGFKFEYLSNSTVKSKNYLKKITQNITSYLKLIKYIFKNKKRYDIIYIYGGSHYYWWIILFFIKLNRIKVINEMTEIPYYNPELKYAIFRNIFLYFIYPLYNGSIVISDSLYEIATKYKSKTSKLIKIPILIKPTPISEIQSSTDSNPYILHTGTMSENKDGIIGIINAFSIASKKINYPIKLIITGDINDSPHKNVILDIINKNNLHDLIIFTGYLKDEEIKKLQSECSLVIINKHDTFQNRYCFSTKLAEYLNYGKTIISTDIGESMNYLKNNINAYIVKAGDPILIADKIVETFENREISSKIGFEGRKLVEKEFNYLYQSQKISHFLKCLTNGKKKN